MPPGESETLRVLTDRTILTVLLFVFLALLGIIVAIPVQLPCDGHEYLCTVTSLIATHNLSFEQEDIRAAARLVSPETFLVDLPQGQNTKINPWSGKRVWGSHTVYMAFIALPFVLLFNAKGFLILNALCFVGMLWFLYRHFRDSNGLPAALGLASACLFLSGVPSYIFWVNSEMLLMLCLFGALYYGLRFKMYRAVFLLAIATAVKPPLVTVFFLLALWHFVQHRSVKTVLLMGVLYTIAIAPHLLYDALQLGRLGPFHLAGQAPKAIPGEAASLFRQMTLLRLWAFWLGPGTGALWFYPAILWCTYRNRYPRWMAACSLAAALLISVMCLVPVNLISTGDGIRYATLAFPLFFFLGGTWKSTRLDWALMAVAAFLGGGLLIDATHSIRTPEWVYAKPFPSMVPAEQCGVPLYPELLFHVGWRLPRNTVVDYADNQNLLRNNVVQIMVRNAQPGEVIVKLLPIPQAESTTVRFGPIGGQSIEQEIPPGRVATLFVPITQDVLKQVAYPEWRPHPKESALTARLRFHFSALSVNAGIGELRWQQRYHGGQMKFLYQVGPRLLNLYPSRSWLIETLASEDILDQRETAPADIFGASRPGVAMNWNHDDSIEGLSSLRVQVPEPEDPKSLTVLMSKKAVSLGDPPEEGLTHIEVSGFLKVGPPATSPADKTTGRAAVGLIWLNNRGDAVGKPEVGSMSRAEAASWQYFLKRVEIPPGAVSVRLALSCEGSVRALGVDDLVISWFKDTWD
jgi:hypothetical protein